MCCAHSRLGSVPLLQGLAQHVDNLGGQRVIVLRGCQEPCLVVQVPQTAEGVFRELGAQLRRPHRRQFKRTHLKPTPTPPTIPVSLTAAATAAVHRHSIADRTRARDDLARAPPPTAALSVLP